VSDFLEILKGFIELENGFKTSVNLKSFGRKLLLVKSFESSKEAFKFQK
jgi:hypothetical protein